MEGAASPSYRQLFAQPSYPWLFAAVTANWSGQAFRQVLMTVYTYQITGTAFGIGLMMFLSIVPTVLFGPLAGVLVDRSDRRRLLVIGYLLSAGLIATLISPLVPGQVLIVAFGLGICSTMNNPANTSYLTQILGPQYVALSVSLTTTVAHGMRIVLPAVAGLTIMRFGTPLAFALCASLYVVAAISVLRTMPSTAIGPVARFRPHDLVVGFRWLISHPGVRFLVIVFLVAVPAIDLPALNTAVYVERVLERHVAELGWLMSALGVGALLGASSSRWLSRFPRAMLFVAGVVVACMALVPVALQPGLVMLVALWMVAGAGVGLMDVSAAVLVLETVPIESRGRVVSAINASITSVMAGWVLTAGRITDVVGPAMMFGVVGATCATAVILVTRGLRLHSGSILVADDGGSRGRPEESRGSRAGSGRF